MTGLERHEQMVEIEKELGVSDPEREQLDAYIQKSRRRCTS
jgi:hypothetical protein